MTIIDRDLRSCRECRKVFEPRSGSGGSFQRFCCTWCRLSFHKKRQRTQRRAAYIARGTTPAISQPERNETPPREPAVAALHPWETGTIDIANCERTEFVVALDEGETAGTRIETWPAEVRVFIDQHVSRWVEDNKEKHTVRAMTVAASKYNGVQACVLILHHVQKGSHPALHRAALNDAKSDGPGNV